jgi:hypothetical protein
MLVREVYQDMAHWQSGLSALRTIIAQYSHTYVVVFVYDSNCKFGKFADHKDITHYRGLSKKDRFAPKPDNMVD